MANLGYIQVTRRCNQCCRFCSNPPIERDIGLEDGKRLVDELASQGYDGVIFTGGEPTLSEHLPALIRHAHEKGLPPRIVTNGQLLGSEPDLLDRLVDAGLDHVHVSLYSHRPDVVASLTGKEDSHATTMKALERLGALDRLAVDVNTVINGMNADHLDEHVLSLTDHFPFIRHFVFNNLDPFMNRVAENPDTIPALWQFELSLMRALKILDARGLTFRVERVPLCYMTEFAHASTETRKIVKSEERTTHFLDDKGRVRQEEFKHEKAECCSICLLDPVCAGMDGVGGGFELSELYPVFIPPEVVIARVMRIEPRQVPPGLVESIAARQRALKPRPRT
ncbi:MAG: radical SAM protein [Deltaproteobacteria bacterium]|nr:radical SAM protein [Deltaproteobacteria bacterium]